MKQLPRLNFAKHLSAEVTLKNLLFSLIFVVSFSFRVDGSEKCAAYLALERQEGFADAIKKISKIERHRIVGLQRPGTNQVVVLLGEVHYKKPADTQVVEGFAKRFGDIAVELTCREGERVKAFATISPSNIVSSSNIARSLLLDSPEHRVHFIDKEIPAICDPHNIAWGVMGSLIFYMGYPAVAMFAANGSVEILMHKLAEPPPIFYVPLTAVAVISLDLALGMVAHLAHAFKLADYLPVTSHLLNKRNVFMVQKISDLMNDPQKRIERLLAIVGSAHLHQMIVEMKKHGFQEILLKPFHVSH